jgi:hypothetical protein
MFRKSFLAQALAICFVIAMAGCSSKSKNPAANAGEDQKVLLGDIVTLDGNSSTGVDNSIWTFISKPVGSNAVLSKEKTLEPKFTADLMGDYEIQLSINNGTLSDTVKVTAKNVIAKIDVGSGSTTGTRERFNTTEYVINLSQEGGILTGEGSRGNISTYSWSEISGPGATSINPLTENNLQFTAPSLAKFLNAADQYKWQPLPISRDDTKMIFKLIVSDSSGNTDSDTFVVYVQDDGNELKTSSGLPNAGIGTIVYMSGPSLKANSGASTAVTDWSWTMTPPADSSAKFADSGSVTSTLQFPKFVPDVAGLYLLAYTSTSASKSGTIWLDAADWVGVGTIAGTSPRSPQCGVCHNGTIEEDTVTPWSETMHASIFQNSISTYAGLAPTPYLWQYHTVGWDTTSTAVNGGFDDLVSNADFSFPESGMTWDAFTGSYPNIAKLANIQCENCHGPGSQHSGDPLRISKSFSQAGICGQCHIEETEWANAVHNSTGIVHGAGRYQLTNWRRFTCVRCHTAKGFVQYVEEGEEGLTDLSDTGAFPGITCQACHDPHDATNSNQLRLHGDVVMAASETTAHAGKAATCYMCHDGFYSKGEHDCDTDEDGLSGVTSIGAIADPDDTVCETIDDMATHYFRGTHYGTQGPVLEGKGVFTDLDNDDTNDFTLTENSFHSQTDFTLAGATGDSSLPSENDKCVTCHMAAGPGISEDGFQNLGGHTFKLRSGHGIGHLQGEETGDDDPAEAGSLELVSACTVCHPSVSDTFNRTARADYDGDGTIEGIQDEVEGLLLALSNRIKAIDPDNVNNTKCSPEGGVLSCGTRLVDEEIVVDALAYAGCCSGFTSGTCDSTNSSYDPSKSCSKTSGSCSNVATDLTRNDYQNCNIFDADAAIRRAMWNHNVIVREGSLGIHNAAFDIQVLQKTYTAISSLLGSGATAKSFAQDFPNATLR